MSGIRPPSKIPAFAPGRELTELSASQNNARHAPAPGMAPPQVIGAKHKTSHASEPVAKRKTLADRAGEPYSTRSAAPPSGRTISGALATTVQAGPRNTSFSASTSRVPATSSRVVSNNSYGASSNARPRSQHGQRRPATGMGHARMNSYHGGGSSRPVTSMAQYAPSRVTPAEAEQNGRVPFSFASPTPAKYIQVKKHSGRSIGPRDRQCGSVARKHCAQRNGPETPVHPLFPASLREMSICSAMDRMRLDDGKQSLGRFKSKSSNDHSNTPSQIPRLAPTPTPSHQPDQKRGKPSDTRHDYSVSLPPSPPKTSPSRSDRGCGRAGSPIKPFFLNKSSNLLAPEEVDANKSPCSAWDVSERMQSMEMLYVEMKNQMEGTAFDRNNFKEITELMKARISELEVMKAELMAANEVIRAELEDCKVKLATSNVTIDDTRRGHLFEIDEMHRKQRNEIGDLQRGHDSELERLRQEMKELDDQLRRTGQDEIDRLLRSHREDLAELERRLNAQLDDERRARTREVQDLTQQRDMQLQSTAIDIGKRDREADELREQIRKTQADLDRQHSVNSDLREKLTESNGNTTSLESTMAAMKAKIDFLESGHQQQSQAFADLHKRMQEAIEQENIAKEKLIAEETLRRKLHNQVQELKGNIRVFCRVRPTLEAEVDEPAKIAYPDAGDENKEIHVQGPEVVSSLGKITSVNNAFSFDCVFGPKAQNAEVFDEISQLVQSALDGYNVCIFCYGQTGSGKTHTMSASDGMIPRAVSQIYECTKKLEERGWTYSMEGSFVEVYNENLNDLLGKAEELDKKKHEIRHDAQTCKTTITDITKLRLDSPEKMEGLLQRAQKNRSVAATKANERSSRSHCVFILNLVGENHITGERSEGTLNLVDLAGSERLSHSGAEGARLKETQNINKSLSCLGDVIAALGDGKANGHVPYRNSKLTYLLQYSLGGNSKTLMFVMVSPLQAHLTDTLTSLKFAKKVHSTHIGTAKKQTKVKD